MEGDSLYVYDSTNSQFWNQLLGPSYTVPKSISSWEIIIFNACKNQDVKKSLS